MFVRRGAFSISETTASHAHRVLVGILLVVGSLARAEDTDKTVYHLFNPTPRELMRELSADRPDITESPLTVDAGRFQIEASIFDYTRDLRSSVDTKTERRTFGLTNLKAGLLPNVDLQVAAELYAVEDVTDKETGARSRIQGFGDSAVRVKANLWGNDGGTTALAVMPFVKLPTAEGDLGNDKVEGGVIFPFGMKLGSGWGLGAMGEFDAVHDEGDDDYDLGFVHSLVVGRHLVDVFGWYGEYVGVVSTDSDHEYEAALGTGITLGLTDDVQLDLGVNAGLTRAAPDFNLFTGFSFRF